MESNYILNKLQREYIDELRRVVYKSILLFEWRKGHKLALEKVSSVLNTIEDSISEQPLVIFDLNNVLIHRVFDKDRKITEGKRFGNHVLWKRPGVVELIEKLMETHHVAIWSSMQEWKVEQAVEFIFGNNLIKKLKFVYDQQHCKRIKVEGQDYPEFTKPLSIVWNMFPQYNETNTLMIDDSKEKMKENDDSCVYCLEKWTHDMVNDEVFKIGNKLDKACMRLLDE